MELNELFLNEDDSLSTGLERISLGGLQIALVVNKKEELIGVLTDSDVRRALLSGAELGFSIRNYYQRDFKSVSEGVSGRQIEKVIRDFGVLQLPVLDADGRCSRIISRDRYFDSFAAETSVVFMVGGRGERLRPLTDNLPKPMLEIAGKPILEIILESYIRAGFRKFYFSVNYMAEKIFEHFGNGNNWGVSIQYLHENSPLGTAGSLYLLPGEISENIVVTNGDLLTRADVGAVLRFHIEEQAQLTVCTREVHTQIPFGVFTLQGSKVSEVREKPKITHHVNAGIYILNIAQLREFFREEQYLDMPDLISELLNTQRRVSAYPVHEYWLDIGRHETLSQAQSEWLHSIT